MYKVYLDEVLLPVAPPAIDIKIGRNGKTYQLISGKEVSVPGKEKLAEISFTFLLPRQEYSFAVYDSGFKPAEYFLDKIGKMKGVVGLKVIGMGINRRVTIEDMTIKEAAGSGDLSVKITLREFAEYGSVSVDVSTLGVVVKKRQLSSRAPLPVDKPKTYTTKAGDTVWSVSKKNYGDESQMREIVKSNLKDRKTDLRPDKRLILHKRAEPDTLMSKVLMVAAEKMRALQGAGAKRVSKYAKLKGHMR